MRKTLAIINLLAVIVMLSATAWIETTPLNGVATASISNRYANLFTPAGFTFAIWAVIYFGLILFALYGLQLAFGKNNKESVLIESIGPWFLLSSVLNGLWLIAWHYDRITLSAVLISGLLVSLVAIYLNIRGAVKKPKPKTTWLVFVPFSVYLGWVSVATIANVSALLTKISWNGWGLHAGYWALIMLVVGIVLAMVMLIRNKDYAFAAVIVWAYIGIIVKRLSVSDPANLGLIVTASLGILFLILMAVLVHQNRVT